MHWFIDPIKDHYIDFDGRATRQQYWMWILAVIIIGIILSGALNILHADSLIGLFHLVILLPGIAIATRRLHDINKSGWWQLLFLIPLVGFIILIVWLAHKGDEGGNRFGQPATLVSSNAGGDTTTAAVATPPMSTVETKPETSEENTTEQKEV